MVSDVLHDAVLEIDRYLSWGDTYQGEELDAILRVRAQMDEVRALLDTTPPRGLRRLRPDQCGTGELGRDDQLAHHR